MSSTCSSSSLFDASTPRCQLTVPAPRTPRSGPARRIRARLSGSKNGGRIGRSGERSFQVDFSAQPGPDKSYARRPRLGGLRWQLRQPVDEVLGDSQAAEADVMELVGVEGHALA